MTGRDTQFHALESEILAEAGEEAGSQYLALAQKWVQGSISLSKLDRKSKGLVSMDLHSKFVLTMGDYLDMSFDRRKKRKRKADESGHSTSPSSDSIAKLIYMNCVSKGLCDEKSSQTYKDLIDEVVKYSHLVDSDVIENETGFQYLKPIRVRSVITAEDVLKSVHKFNWLIPRDRVQQFVSVLESMTKAVPSKRSKDA